MDAHLFRATIVAAALCSMGAGYRTQNFVVNAPTKELAKEIGDEAERYRRELSVEWLGKEMPPWAEPCLLTAQVSPRLGAGGATTFVFDRGEVFGWRMRIQGSRERILDSVLPHEVTHTVFACHFRQPLPRWADEGACTTVEAAAERDKQKRMLIRFLQTGRGIPFSKMFAMKEYPRDVLPLYSQGYSLARYLIAKGGKQKFLNFVGDGLRDENWTRAIKKHYGYDNLLVLQNTWLAWVKDGSPLEDASPDVYVASNTRRPRPEPNLIYRGQSPDGPAELKSAQAGTSDQMYEPVFRRNASRPESKAEWKAPRRSSPGEYPNDSNPKRPVNVPPANATSREVPLREVDGTRQVILQWSRTPSDTPDREEVAAAPILDATANAPIRR